MVFRGLFFTCITVVFFSTNHSMDNDCNLLFMSDWAQELRTHIIEKNLMCSTPEYLSNIKQRRKAFERIYATRDDGSVVQHKKIIDSSLLFPLCSYRVDICGNQVTIGQADRKIGLIDSLGKIRAFAFNADGLVFASVSDQELMVSNFTRDAKDGQELNIRLKRFFYGIRHVALSDSGDRVAVGIDAGYGLRVMVIDVPTQQLLYDLSGAAKNGFFRLFYMMGENIIAAYETSSSMEYNLSCADESFKQLSDEQKGFLSKAYDCYKKTKKPMILYSSDCASCSLYDSLPYTFRLWARQFVYVVRSQ